MNVDDESESQGSYSNDDGDVIMMVSDKVVVMCEIKSHKVRLDCSNMHTSGIHHCT